MRVIAGTARGTKLKVPRGGAVRPTSGRVKEALFNILGPRVCGAVLWDLCAGSGAIGIEALSRGAAEAIFVERERAHLQTISENLDRAKLSDRARLMGQDVEPALALLARRKEKADLIFSDPPYQEQTVPELLKAISRYDLLDRGGLLILELFSRSKLWPQKHPAVGFRKYGDSILVFIEAPHLEPALAGLKQPR